MYNGRFKAKLDKNNSVLLGITKSYKKILSETGLSTTSCFSINTCVTCCSIYLWYYPLYYRDYYFPYPLDCYFRNSYFRDYSHLEHYYLDYCFLNNYYLDYCFQRYFSSPLPDAREKYI